MKTELELKNGKRRKFSAPLAKVLVARGLGKEVGTMGYQTRELRAEPQVKTDPEIEALKAELDERGIKYHHRAGIAKLRELLSE